MNQVKRRGATAGFSLVELLIAMTITLIMMGAATSLLSAGFRFGIEENAVSDAAADGQRALNIMSREIANAGFNLITNGVVAQDSDSTHLRVRSNLNKFDTTASIASRNGVIDASEDVQYFVNGGAATDYLVRYDVNTASKTVLANRLSALRIYYFPQRVTYNTTTLANGTTDCRYLGFFQRRGNSRFGALPGTRCLREHPGLRPTKFGGLPARFQFATRFGRYPKERRSARLLKYLVDAIAR